MTRYYFDVRQKDGWYRDEFGIELADFAEAREQVLALMPDLARDAAWSGDHHAVICQVRDDVSGVVYEGELVFNGRARKRG